MPEISICIPSYKHSEFVRRALDSLVDQTFKDFEVVVTDDSPDNQIEKVCNQYRDKFKIKYFKNSATLGSPENWNESIRKANGKWIKILHHDDWFNDPYGLSKFHQLTIDNPNVSFHFCTTRIVNHNTGEVTFNKPSEIQLELITKSPLKLMYGNFIGPPSSTLFRKDTKIFFDANIKYVVDIDFYIRLFNAFPGFGFCKEPLINNMSSHPDQVTAASLDRKTQLGEYIYLYNKLNPNAWPEREALLLFRTLFLKYEIRSERDLQLLNFELPKPRWIFNLLLFYLNKKHHR